jgi:hypothetical protein
MWILKFDLKFSYISHDSLKGEIKRNLPHIEHEEPPTQPLSQHTQQNYHLWDEPIRAFYIQL